MDTRNTKAIELVLFRPKSTFSIDEVKRSLESLDEILSSYKGFLKRHLAVSGNGQWMDLVLWESMDDAKFAADDILKNEKAIEAFSVIDQNEMQFFHFEPLNRTNLHE